MSLPQVVFAPAPIRCECCFTFLRFNEFFYHVFIEEVKGSGRNGALIICPKCLPNIQQTYNADTPVFTDPIEWEKCCQEHKGK